MENSSEIEITINSTDSIEIAIDCDKYDNKKILKTVVKPIYKTKNINNNLESAKKSPKKINNAIINKERIKPLEEHINSKTEIKTEEEIEKLQKSREKKENLSNEIQITMKHKGKIFKYCMSSSDSFRKIYADISKDYKIKFQNLVISKFNTLKGVGFLEGGEYEVISYNINGRTGGNILINVNIREGVKKKVEVEFSENVSKILELISKENTESIDIEINKKISKINKEYKKVIFNGEDITKKLVEDFLDEGFIVDVL